MIFCTQGPIGALGNPGLRGEPGPVGVRMFKNIYTYIHIHIYFYTDSFIILIIMHYY